MSSRTRTTTTTSGSSSGHLTWEQATAKFIPWALAAMVGFGVYNLDKLATSVSNLNVQLATIIVTDREQTGRLDRQGKLLMEVVDENSLQSQEIAALKAYQDKN